MGYRAIRTELDVARDPLMRLWRDNLPVAGDLDAKLAWFYREAPAGEGAAFLLASDDAAAVGCAGLAGRELAVLGGDAPARLRVALLADFAIDRAHRSAMPALVLQRAVKRYVDDAGFALSYGFPNDHAVAIHRRTGYRELGRMARFVRVLRHGGYLERRYGWRRRSRLGGAVADGAALAASTVRALATARTYALRWEAGFDARWDDLWARVEGGPAPGFQIATRRTSALLAWRFRAPTVATLVERAGGALAAYAVVRRSEAGDVAELADVFGASPAALDALFAQLVPALYVRGFAAVLVRYLGHPALRRVLADHWFSFRNTDRSMIVAPTPTCPVDPAILLDSNAWYVTELDEDT